MAITYGLTDQGLVVKSRLVIRDDFNNAFRRAFGNAINLSDASVFGVIVAIFADRVGELWELLEQIASSQDPDKAAASLLDALCLITGTERPLAARSTVTLTFTGVAGTTVPGDNTYQAVTTLKDFLVSDPTTLVSVPDWQATSLYVIGDRVTNNLSVYQCIQAGTSAGSGGPTGTETDATPDNTVLWTFVGEGVAAADQAAESVDEGSIVGAYKDIRKINNAISGLQGVTNLEPAILGRLVAKDPELRILRESELGKPGSSPFDALVGKLLEVSGVSTVDLFANNTDLTNADGVPPHSVEALVRGGADQDIFDKLLASVAAGIGTFGNVTGTAIDKTGRAQTMSFSRAVEVHIHARIVLTYDAELYPADGDTQVEAAVLSYGVAQGTGKDVTASAVGAQAFRALPSAINNVVHAMIFTDTIGAPVAWAPSTAYSATPGARSVVTNADRAYICITSGTSAGSGGPTTTSTNITDGSAHWYFLGTTISITSHQQAVYDSVVIDSSSSTP